MKILVAVALTWMKAGATGSDAEQIDRLSKAAECSDRTAIEAWFEDNDQWLCPDYYEEDEEDAPGPEEQLLTDLKSVAAKVAEFFRFRTATGLENPD